MVNIITLQILILTLFKNPYENKFYIVHTH